MTDSVLLLILLGILMLPNRTSQIIIYRSASHDPGLCPSVKGQRIQIEARLFILYKRTVADHLLKRLPGALIDLLRIQIRLLRELCLRTVYLQK